MIKLSWSEWKQVEILYEHVAVRCRTDGEAGLFILTRCRKRGKVIELWLEKTDK